MAALGASDPAGQPPASPPGGVRKRCVDDLDQLRITRGKGHPSSLRKILPQSSKLWQTERMAECSKCQGFAERVNMTTPGEYQTIVRQMIEIVGDGTFLVVHSDYTLEEVAQEVWPGDIICHDFRCAACGRGFQLFADTYHGHAHWMPLD